MKKSVTDYSREELARMFPVELKPHDPRWAAFYTAERDRILAALGSIVLRAEHFGSTSIPGIAAKDTIDILLGVPDDADNDVITGIMRGLGYDVLWHPDGDPPYLVFVKGYNPDGRNGQAFHVHMAALGHRAWERLLFRDYLRAHPETAHAYEALKIRLAAVHRYDRMSYRAAKTDFVTAVMDKAKAQVMRREGI